MLRKVLLEVVHYSARTVHDRSGTDWYLPCPKSVGMSQGMLRNLTLAEDSDEFPKYNEMQTFWNQVRCVQNVCPGTSTSSYHHKCIRKLEQNSSRSFTCTTIHKFSETSSKSTKILACVRKRVITPSIIHSQGMRMDNGLYVLEQKMRHGRDAEECSRQLCRHRSRLVRREASISRLRRFFM